MVAHNQDVVLGRTGFGGPVDEVGERIDIGHVVVLGAINILLVQQNIFIGGIYGIVDDETYGLQFHILNSLYGLVGQFFVKHVEPILLHIFGRRVLVLAGYLYLTVAFGLGFVEIHHVA